MKKTLILGLSLLGCVNTYSQSNILGFEFTTIKENPITSIKDQHRSGTCWCHSSLGYFEAELLRQGKG